MPSVGGSAISSGGYFLFESRFSLTYNIGGFILSRFAWTADIGQIN